MLKAQSLYLFLHDSFNCNKFNKLLLKSCFLELSKTGSSIAYQHWCDRECDVSKCQEFREVSCLSENEKSGLGCWTSGLNIFFYN